MLGADFVVISQLWIVVGRVGVQGPGSWSWKKSSCRIEACLSGFGRISLGEQCMKEEGGDGTGNGRGGSAGLVTLWAWEHMGQQAKKLLKVSLLCWIGGGGPSSPDSLCRASFLIPDHLPSCPWDLFDSSAALLKWWKGEDPVFQSEDPVFQGKDSVF